MFHGHARYWVWVQFQIHATSFTRSLNGLYHKHPVYQYIQINLQENILKSILVKIFLSSLRSKIPPDQHTRYLVSRQNMVRISLIWPISQHDSRCVWVLRSTYGNHLECPTVASVTFISWMKISKSGGQVVRMQRKRRRKHSSAAPAFCLNVLGLGDIPPNGHPGLQKSHIKTRKTRYFRTMRKLLNMLKMSDVQYNIS